MTKTGIHWRVATNCTAQGLVVSTHASAASCRLPLHGLGARLTEKLDTALEFTQAVFAGGTALAFNKDWISAQGPGAS